MNLRNLAPANHNQRSAGLRAKTKEGVATMENSPTDKETTDTHRAGGPDDTRGPSRPEVPESQQEKKPGNEEPPLYR